MVQLELDEFYLETRSILKPEIMFLDSDTDSDMDLDKDVNTQIHF